MDPISIPHEQITPIDDIAPGVRGLRIAFVNVFAVTHSDNSWTLVDAGLALSDGMIRNWAEKHFSTPPKDIVLTHGHVDHAGGALALADRWNVPVYAHPLEFPYLTGEREYPAPNVGAGGGLMTLLSPLLPSKPPDLRGRLKSLAETDPMDIVDDPLPGWQILHTPGHTPGHVSFFRPSDGLLLVGDAFCTTKPESLYEVAIAQEPELHGPPAYLTSNWTQARASVEMLSRLDLKIVAPGHGQPLSGPGLADGLHKLAANFDELAIPENRQSEDVNINT